MKIIIMYILRNIGEKKFRTFLILLSICLSCALFFASNSFSITFSKMFEMRIRQFIGSSDFTMYSNWKSPSWFIPKYKLAPIMDSLEYAVGAFTFDGTFKPARAKSRKNKNTQALRAVSIDYDQVHLMNPLFIVKERQIKPFRGRKIIISSDFAQKYNLQLGDGIDLTLDDNKYRFYIEAIGEPRGILQNDSRRPSVIIPISMARSIFKTKNMFGIILVKVKKGVDKNEVFTRLKKIYNRYTVQEAIDEEERRTYMNQTTIAFQMMTILVLCISVFIIYSTFKVITMERLPVIGTFRSIGANKKTTDSILLFESVAYGIIGGILGLLLGFLILVIMVYIMSYNPWSKTRTAMILDFKVTHIVMTFFLGILLCTIGSLIPILKVTTISIKDIVLQNYKSKVKKGNMKALIGVLIMAAALVSPLIFQKSAFALGATILSLIISVIGVIMLVPYITAGFIFLYKAIYGYFFGNIGQIAARNLRDNKSLLNTITLLCIGISAILTINTISFTVSHDIVNFFSKAKFDVWLWVYRSNRNTRLRLSTIDGVTASLGTYTGWDVAVENRDKRIGQLDGLSEPYLDYWQMEDVPIEMISRLEEDRNILLSKILMKKLKAIEGDVIKLKTPKGIRDYKVIGSFSTNRNSGDIAFASNKYIKLDFKMKHYDNILVKTDKDPARVLEAMRDKFDRQGFWGETLVQMEQNINDSNRQLFLILKGFSLLTLIIGIFGVINNYVINFIERKRSLAMYRAIGMSKIQIVKMICIEAFSGGLTGALSGIIYGMVFIYIVKYVMLAMDMYIPIRYSLSQFAISLVAGIAISLISSISPALQSSKLNIIEAIKYE